MIERLIRRSTNMDVFLVFVASIAVVGFWRGVWNLMDHYILTNNFLWSQIATILGGIVLLLLLAQLKDKDEEKKK